MSFPLSGRSPGGKGQIHSCIKGRIPRTCLDCAGSPGRGNPCTTCDNKGFNLFFCPRCYPNQPTNNNSAHFNLMGGGTSSTTNTINHQDPRQSRPTTGGGGPGPAGSAGTGATADKSAGGGGGAGAGSDSGGRKSHGGAGFMGSGPKWGHGHGNGGGGGAGGVGFGV